MQTQEEKALVLSEGPTETITAKFEPERCALTKWRTSEDGELVYYVIVLSPKEALKMAYAVISYYAGMDLRPDSPGKTLLRAMSGEA